VGFLQKKGCVRSQIKRDNWPKFKVQPIHHKLGRLEELNESLRRVEKGTD